MASCPLILDHAGSNTAVGSVTGGAVAGPPGAVVGAAVGAGAGAGAGDKTEEHAEGEDTITTTDDRP